MYGKVVNLDRPLILLKKNKQKMLDISDDEDEKMDEEDKESAELKNTRTEYLINAVIRKKFLFNKRPRPIVYLESKNVNE